MGKSWLQISPDSPFSLANLPFGIVSTPSNQWPHAAVAIGDYVLDLSAFVDGGGFSELPALGLHHYSVFSGPWLNDFAGIGRQMHTAIRNYLQDVLSDPSPYPDVLQNNQPLRKDCLIQLSHVSSHIPLDIGDYTDFYAGLHHAFNVGVLFRGPENALQPNYAHLPVGYHGRASSVVVSGTPIVRPCGQILPTPGSTTPIYAATQRLDFELELAAFVCSNNALGSPIPIADAERYIFGYALLNDWSARDVQAWEYVPLGPFNGKNFASSISAWIVLADALEPFRTTGLRHVMDTLPDGKPMPELLPYLREKREDTLFDIELSVALKPKGAQSETVLSRTNARNLLFSFPQMLAHHSVSGCPMRQGDMLGSGTISGAEPTALGSMLEMTHGGKEPVALEGGKHCRFLEDGDEVVIRGVAGMEGGYVGFGDCRGVILPARLL